MALSFRFRRHAKSEFARLLDYWRTIEYGIKRAEQINSAAVIPAINELRYASRQFYVGLRTYSKATLTDNDEKDITKRIFVAEQYLQNADHDTIDSVISFYKKITSRITGDYGMPEITIHFPEFPLLLQKISECEALILETRQEYEKRRPNYDKIRQEYFDFFVEKFEALETAEVNAAYDKKKLERELVLKQKTINVLTIISVVSSVVGILGFGFTIYSFFFHEPTAPP